MSGHAQLAFVQPPRIAVDFDPRSLAYGSPDDHDAAYADEWGLFWGCYVAWPPGFPCVAGQGSSEHWAIVDLARRLRGVAWPAKDELSPQTQLEYAAQRLTETELVVYLERLAEPAQLADQYSLVLR